MNLQGKRALITGGTRGLGAAAARRLAQAGCDVAVNGRHDDDAAQSVVADVAATGRRAVMITADVADEAQATDCVAQAVDRLGGLDILIHSAGGPAPGAIEQLTPEAWRHAFAVHVDAAFYLCRAALPSLRAHGEGAIVLVSSAAGVRGCPGALAYGTVKGAILQFTRALARDLADDGVRVNCVAPGIIRTRFHDVMTPEQQRHNLAVRIPLHREGGVDDVAEAILLLASNDFITGESIVIDGGMSMQMCR